MKVNVKGLGEIEAENSGPNIVITAVHHNSNDHVVVEVSKQEWLRFCQAGMALTK